MLLAKSLADVLTASRLMIALILTWLGIHQNPATLPLAIVLLLASWITDGLDGPLARRGAWNHQTWIGDHDLEIDVLVSLGLLCYLIFAHFLSWPYGAIYLLLWATICFRWGWQRELAMVFQGPIYLWFMLISLRDAPTLGLILPLWVLTVVTLTWPRFPKEIVPGFLSGMKELFKQTG